MKLARNRLWMIALIATLSVASGAVADGQDSPAPWLGVRLGGTFAPEQGVAVSRIFVDSPADRAGLRARDVIVAFDGQPLASPGELIERIRSHEPGAWVPLTVLRQDDEIELDVRLDDRPKVIAKSGMRRGWIGVEAIDLPRSLREHFGAPPEAGVMVSEVVAGGPAEAAGFRLGDVVYEVGGVSVASLPVLQELIAGGGVGNEYEFSVARDGAVLVLESALDTAPAEGR
jgi:serine protease Do